MCAYSTHFLYLLLSKKIEVLKCENKFSHPCCDFVLAMKQSHGTIYAQWRKNINDQSENVGQWTMRSR